MDSSLESFLSNLKTSELILPDLRKSERSKSKIVYSLNSSGYRCSEFSNFVPNESTVFAGCSTTFGEALEEDNVWARLLYNKMINKNIMVGEYFNLGITGITIPVLISNLFVFFKQYGNPKNVIICFPDIERSKGKDIIEKQIKAKWFYYFLNTYCKKNKINIFSFSWDIQSHYFYKKNISTNYIFKNIENFYFIDPDVWTKSLYETMKENKAGPDDFFAEDGVHFGRYQHIVMSNFVYDHLEYHD